MINYPRLAFFTSKTGSNLKAIVSSCDSGSLKAKPVIVISNNQNSEALIWAKSHGLHNIFLNVEKAGSQKSLDNLHLKILQAHKIDFVILAGYLEKIGKGLLSFYKNRIINIHPSLLPKYGGKGMYGIKIHQKVISSGDKVTGITVHLANEDYDKGVIIAQKKIKVSNYDTPLTLSTKVLEEEHFFYSQTLRKIFSGEIDLLSLG